ncbi:hypothetical protein BDV98DRAFT_88968 [Pterulicium gracile]|uniref:Aminoglycoside phosphotransferase domain-containing protein n=1 Tax=Pterulicium gracile TaxID=1884261 RepID=A0A5C3QGE3_9AGAR|nr:hypothetical protein BDV98DRAFT_88968 [Pterula gracilis]
MLVAGSIFSNEQLVCEPLALPVKLVYSTHDPAGIDLASAALAAIPSIIPRPQAAHTSAPTVWSSAIKFFSMFSFHHQENLFLSAPGLPYPNTYRALDSPTTTTRIQIFAQEDGRNHRFVARLITIQPVDPLLSTPFVHKYSIDLHALCDSEGHAPKLIAYNPLPVGWFMVVIEHHDMKGTIPFDPVLHADDVGNRLRKLFSTCHEKGLVLESLRKEDIWCYSGKPGEFTLLKLQFGGVAGEVLHGLDSTDCWVVPGSIITKEDDLAMLDALLRS